MRDEACPGRPHHRFNSPFKFQSHICKKKNNNDGAILNTTRNKSK